jgi:NAD(P)-dependent dehydrogenase (short-subunit alcohol dehydrogenase family)
MGRLDGKVALITGGASGLGRACGILFAAEGARVALSDLNDALGEQTAAEIRERGGEALYLHQDVTEEAEWERTIAAVRARFGRLDVLLNNAGIGMPGDVEHCTLEQWRQIMRVNLDAVFLGTKYAILAMKESGGGSIINFSSIEGIIGDPSLAAYNASKGGVRVFTKSSALYCAKAGYNIRVNSIHPGYIWTPMVENYLREQGDVEGGRRMIDALHPVGHLGEPDDIAYGALYLAADESKFVTGSEMVIDGGYTAQ